MGNEKKSWVMLCYITSIKTKIVSIIIQIFTLINYIYKKNIKIRRQVFSQQKSFESQKKEGYFAIKYVLVQGAFYKTLNN